MQERPLPPCGGARAAIFSLPRGKCIFFGILLAGVLLRVCYLSEYSAFDKKDVPVDTTVGFVSMRGNWFTAGGEALKGDASGYKPSYKVVVDQADAELVVRVRNESGPR